MVTRTANEARALVEQWLPKFGFGHYTFKLSPLPKAADGKTWGRCVWLHDEETARFQFVPDGVLSKAQLETVVLHELAHGLLELAGTSEHAEEVVCNRIVRLLRPSTAQANEHLLNHADWNDKTVPVDALRALVDRLPEGEREAINMRFYERLSYGEIAEELDLPYRQDAVRLLRRALRQLSEMLAEEEQ